MLTVRKRVRAYRASFFAKMKTDEGRKYQWLFRVFLSGMFFFCREGRKEEGLFESASGTGGSTLGGTNERGL